MKHQAYRTIAILALLAGACAARLSAATITLTADDLLGTVFPGTPNSPENGVRQVSHLVTKYNEGLAAGTNLGNLAADPQNETYTLYRPVGAPGTLAAPIAASAENMQGPSPLVDLGGFMYQYLLISQASKTWIYYIGDIGGNNVINWGGNPLTAVDASNENGSAISHYLLFNKSTPPPTTHSVPDGGATVLLAGAGLFLTAFAARRTKKSA